MRKLVVVMVVGVAVACGLSGGRGDTGRVRQELLTQGELFPKMDAGNLPIRVYDLRGRHDQDWATAEAIQGLVNGHPAHGAHVYLVTNDVEKFWLDHASFPGRSFFNGDAGTRLEDLFDYAANKLSPSPITGGFISYDRYSEWSFPAALGEAAVTSGVPVEDDQLFRLSLINPLTGQGGKLRYTSGNWNPDASLPGAIDWSVDPARGNLLSRSSNDVVFMLAPGVLRLYDYVTATRGFVFNADLRDAGYETVRTKINNVISHSRYRTSLPTPVLGYHHGPAYGDRFFEVASNGGLFGIGASYFGNASIWTSFPRVAARAQMSGFVVVPKPQVLYAGIFLSDGDNIQYNQNFIQNWVENPVAADLNVGVSVNAGLVDFAPPIRAWVESHLLPGQELVGGPNGLGFAQPNLESADYSSWIALNREYATHMGIASAQLWKNEAQVSSSSNEAVHYLARQPGLSGVITTGGEHGTPHVYGRQVAVDTHGVTLPNSNGTLGQFLTSEWYAKFGACGGTCPGAFAAEQLNQMVSASDFYSQVSGFLNDGSVVMLSPRDWFASIRDQYLRPASGDMKLAEFGTAVGGSGTAEEAVFVSYNVNAIDNDHRYADLNWWFAYDLPVPTNSNKLKLILDVGGDYKITVSKPNGSSAQTFVPVSGTGRHTREILVDSTILAGVGSIKVKFEDRDTSNGGGASLWMLTLKTLPQELLQNLSNPIAVPCGSGLPCYDVGSSNAGYDVDHLFADGNTGVIQFKVDTAPFRRNVVEVDVRGQFVIEGVRATGSCSWTKIASAHFKSRQTIRVDLAPILSCVGGNTVKLRFTDARPSDGNGASVWNAKVLVDDWEQAAFFVQNGSPREETALLMPSGSCNLSSTSGGARSAHGVDMFTYRLHFPGSMTAHVLLELAGQYNISAAPEMALADTSCSGPQFQLLATSLGVTSKHQRSLSLDAIAAASPTRTVYLRFSDPTPANGNGPSLYSLRAITR